MSEEVNASVTDEDFHATVAALEGLPDSVVPISADAAKRHAAVTAFMIALCSRKEAVTSLTDHAKASITDIFSKLESNLVSSIHKLRDEMLAGIREGAAEGDEATARAFAKGSAARDSLAGMQADCEDDEEKARAAMVANASGE